jgi:hypothetical protein
MIMALTTLTALFETYKDAERAAESLVAAGLPRSQISVLGSRSADDSSGSGGFLSALKDLFIPESDQAGYAEGIRGGRTLVTARVEQSQAGRITEILEQQKPIDLDEHFGGRETGWSTHNNPYLTGDEDATQGANLGASMAAGRSETDQAGVAPAGNPVVEGGEPGPNMGRATVGRVRRYESPGR